MVYVGHMLSMNIVVILETSEYRIKYPDLLVNFSARQQKSMNDHTCANNRVTHVRMIAVISSSGLGFLFPAQHYCKRPFTKTQNKSTKLLGKQNLIDHSFL